MDKSHDVQKIELDGSIMVLHVDGKRYEIDLSRCSERLAAATQLQRANFEVSSTGYGIHWPEIDEDLSIDGLIGAKHETPATRMAT
ncbi:MAG TPA: DUF2442 domain-containing protein [Thermoguttaceae bacterium]|nr:DUF2442 domain-containing protein [Thermoguttaceae bacterium]